MEVFGNVEALKKAIESRYSQKVKEAEKEREKQLAETERELKRRLELLRSHMKTATDADAKKAYSMILSKERLIAKKEFEEKRELLIESVFKEADKNAKKIIYSERYVEYIRKNMPTEENLTCIGDDEYYKKFFPEMNVKKNLGGIKFESEGIIYDFTLSNLIASKKDILRHEVSKALFG